ncbi:2-phospho-L-lactate guanylyltransferase CofC [Methanobrevibacter ruminantium M1]|uniref:2-phospho-L-lactate guanylyltransferase n=1 Tax=Methanobrevibacter ruminantium (strain ATCC 35063 / DSM 1093 / JCM 13430 / OCM 146 / M1) TaxID=634498 RepID=COFC_METRM|nr:2-phospho-L-lactate guanylyltransferase [Methanobrevibacter ruminantium]D3E2P3.1 RecName: Full=2-phospho-L-lactate guanylyltransferase; Short=LP guanylyltransferase [Methanobrevibacter ruminantium M1]ADC46804.1 2-phospho-L-lactate guanylyltransferase CofC [Methanobrevibacter ruminantium M1]
MDKIYAIIPVNQFANAKTRLSPFLTPEERRDLLKAMLKDITDTLKPIVDKVVIISRDEEVLAYAEELELTTIVEEEYKKSKAVNSSDDNPLNKALKQAMKWSRKKTRKVIILPSDIPLIGKTNVKLLIDQAKNFDFIIVPSKGGGTNTLIIKPLAIDMKFEGFSFNKHIEEAKRKKLVPIVHDSFYMALDVNTTEDLGEIMLHGNGTETKKYLESLGIKVESSHDHERLKVTRD